MFRTKFVEKIKTNILHSRNFVFSKNRAVYGIMWKKKDCTAGQATDDNITWRMRFA
jgi:hypothetical protein